VKASRGLADRSYFSSGSALASVGGALFFLRFASARPIEG